MSLSSNIRVYGLHLTKSAIVVSNTHRASPTMKHSLVVTEGLRISFAAGFQSPRTTRVIGVINPEPLPYNETKFKMVEGIPIPIFSEDQRY